MTGRVGGQDCLDKGGGSVGLGHSGVREADTNFPLDSGEELDPLQRPETEFTFQRVARADTSGGRAGSKLNHQFAD